MLRVCTPLCVRTRPYRSVFWKFQTLVRSEICFTTAELPFPIHEQVSARLYQKLHFPAERTSGAIFNLDRTFPCELGFSLLATARTPCERVCSFSLRAWEGLAPRAPGSHKTIGGRFLPAGDDDEGSCQQNSELTYVSGPTKGPLPRCLSTPSTSISFFLL